MATTSLSDYDVETNDDNMQVEMFYLIWLDANANRIENRNIDKKLRSIISQLKKFQDISLCKKFIEERSKHDRITMIVSGRFGREIVPAIHKLRQVISIYVYCMDKKANEEWSCKYRKVKAVATELNELINRLSSDHKIQKKIEEPISFTTSTGGGESTMRINGEFVFLQVLMDCLLRLKSTDMDREELIDYCKQQYKNNTVELRNVHKFQDTYSPDNVLWWYTLESFFYKTLNAALRNKNIHTIFLFREFIADIRYQLKLNQVKKPVRVYRGQMMSKDELNTIKNSVGRFISINSLFSTSVDYEQALVFLNMSDSAENFERILFEIEADPKVVTTKSFADISRFSDFPGEAEILFMLGSIFRVNKIDCSDDGRVWIIRMNLCNDEEHELQEVLMHMKQQTGAGETNLLIFGKLLFEMSKLELAEKYFIRFLEQLPPKDPILTNLYEELAKVAAQNKDLNKCMKWHQKVIALNPNYSTSNPIITQPRTARVIPNIPANATWIQIGVTIAGGNGQGGASNQLDHSFGLYVDNDQTVIIADRWNCRIMQWKKNDTNGQVIAGGNGAGDGLDQLYCPTDVLIDTEMDSLIIADRDNRRVVRWPLSNDTTQGEILIDNINCYGLAADNQGYLYVSDTDKHAVRRYKHGDENGIVVAGGNSGGEGLNQLNSLTYVFVDQQQNVYVSDNSNHRVMKWNKGAKEGIVVAGGKGNGNALTQLYYPEGVFVDTLGTLYIADSRNNRVLRWPQGATQGTVIVGGKGQGSGANQLDCPVGLSFDRHGNLYVADYYNHRVQRFSIE